MDIELIRPLYTQPPADFVATRTALAKALKADGNKDVAAAVAKLRRPKVAEYALNHAVATDPEPATRWARAVATTEDAQAEAIGSSTAGGLRDALGELRAATAALVAAAVEGLGADGAGQRDAIADLLRGLTHRAGAAQVVAAVVGSEQIVPDDLFAGATAPGRPSPAAVRGSRAASARTKGPKAAVEPAAPAPRVTPEEKARAAALAKERVRARRDAERAVAGARRRVSTAEAAAKDARDRFDAATRELDDARREATAAVHVLEHLDD